jgi:MFS family permease
MSSSGSKGSLAAVSAIAGILAAILGGWLTGHWLWAPACGLLVLLGVVAGAESLKAKHENENRDESEPAVAVSLGGNASLADTLIAGGDISQNRTITNIDRSRTNNFRGTGGLAAVLAILAFAGAVGGTVSLSPQPELMPVESPQSLVNGGNHSSPEAAVKGYIGNALLGNAPGACSFVLPDEQAACLDSYVMAPSSEEGSTVPLTGSVGVRNAIIDGSLALVPVIGRLCSSGGCESFSGDGLPAGASFEAAFQQAMGSNDNANLLPSEEIEGSWYVSDPTCDLAYTASGPC